MKFSQRCAHGVWSRWRHGRVHTSVRDSSRQMEHTKSDGTSCGNLNALWLHVCICLCVCLCVRAYEVQRHLLWKFERIMATCVHLFVCLCVCVCVFMRDSSRQMEHTKSDGTSCGNLNALWLHVCICLCMYVCVSLCVRACTSCGNKRTHAYIHT